MQVKPLHLRMGAIGAGIVLVALFLLGGGTLGGRRVVQIEFGAAPGEFEGLAVEIDGRVVGRLERFGEATRSGFEVARGTHSVCVRHPDIPCEPASVALDRSGEKARLMLDFEERYDAASRSMQQVLVLR
jgi:hypothetical protein